MKRLFFFINVIILLILISCGVNNQLPLKKVDPPIYKGMALEIYPIYPDNTKCMDTLSFIKSDIQRNLLLSLILRYPLADVFYSKEYADPLALQKGIFQDFIIIMLKGINI